MTAVYADGVRHPAEGGIDFGDRRKHRAASGSYSMTTRERDMNGVIGTLLQATAGLQSQCAEQTQLMAAKLPGLTTIQRRALDASSKALRALADRTRQHAELMHEVARLMPLAKPSLA